MTVRGRHGARRLLLQALYQRQVGGHGLEELLAQFRAAPGFERVDGTYFTALLETILERAEDLDRQIAAAADRPPAQLDPVERALLWIGLADLSAPDDVPRKVVIDEAVRLAKEFGAQDSFRFINAVLDRAAAAGTSPADG